MNNNDYAEFAAIWSSMIEMQATRDVSDGAIDMAFDLLKDFELSMISRALTKHCRSNKWAAKPAEIIELILGKHPSVESMAGLARNPISVLGLFLHHLVGGYEIKVMPDEQLIRRIKTHEDPISDFIGRAQAGEYSDKEIQMFAGSRIDPSGDLCNGLRGPAREHHASIDRRYQAAIVPAIESVPEPITEDQKDCGRNEIAKIMKSLDMAPKPKPEPDDEHERNKQQVQVASTSQPSDRTAGRKAIENLRKAVE